jgi:hypothetical protein
VAQSGPQKELRAPLLATKWPAPGQNSPHLEAAGLLGWASPHLLGWASHLWEVPPAAGWGGQTLLIAAGQEPAYGEITAD